MNINAINPVLLRNKIMKSSELKDQPVPTDEPVSKPEEVMNVLNAKAMNNIAFQGLQTSKIVQAGKKLVLPAAIAALGLLTTSCNPEDYMPKPTDIDVTVNVENNIDMSAIIALLQQLLEQGKINQEQQTTWQKEMLALAQALVDGQITQTQYLEELVRIQTAMLEEVAKNTANGEAILDRLDALEAKYDNNQITLQEYVDALKALLESVDTTLKDILAEVKGLSEKITEFHKDFVETRDSLYTNMDTIIEQNKLNGEAIERFHESFKNLEKDVAGIRANTDSLIVIANDKTKHEELLKAIEASKADPIQYEKFEEMFKVYGLSITDALEMSNEELKALLIEWRDNQLALEEKQIVLLGELLKQAQDLAERPGLDLADVEKAIKEFQEAYETGNKDLLGSLNGIQNTLDEIDASIDAIYDKLGAYANQVTTYHEIFVKQFDIAIELLLDNGLTLEALKDEQNATNKKLDAFAPKADELIKLMQEFVNKGYGDFPMDKFIEYMNGYGDANIKNLRELFIEMGLDKLDENTAPLKDYKALLEEQLAETKANGGKLDTIISLMEQLLAKGYTLDELKVIIKEVVDNHKCNCDCGDGNHEGILDDTENKLEGLV